LNINNKLYVTVVSNPDTEQRTLSAEMDQVLRKVGQCAADMAWKIERERTQSGKTSRLINTWSKRQVDELLSKGVVSRVQPVALVCMVEW